MGDPTTARAQRSQAIAARVEKKHSEAEAKKRAAAAKRGKRKTGDTSNPGVIFEDVFSVPSAPSSTTLPGPPKRKYRRQNPAGDVNSDDDEDTSPVLHPDDPANFLKLSQALQILLAREITEEEINEADVLLRAYVSELVNVSGIRLLMFEPHLTQVYSYMAPML